MTDAYVPVTDAFGPVASRLAACFADMPPGALSIHVTNQHADYFIRDQLAVLAELNLRPVGGRYAGWCPMPASFLEHTEPAVIAAMVELRLERWLRPWKYPDQPALRAPFDLYPRLGRLERAVRRRRASYRTRRVLRRLRRDYT